MKTLETLHLNDAVGKKNKFQRNRTHLTTMEIGEIVPIMHEELIPGDSVNVSEGIFSRLAPLAVPTYGAFSLRTATMFVDYYQLFAGAESFFAGKSISRGQNVKLPTITKGNILQIFLNSDCSTAVSQVPTSSAEFDFCFTQNSSEVQYKKFTRFGKWVFKCLRSLGYQIPNFVSSGIVSNAPGYNTKLNALPLLAFFKAYNDYMSQSQRFDTSVLSARLEAVRLGKDYTDFFTASSGNVLPAGVVASFKNVKLQYENDYFTSCWQTPNNPINSQSGDLTSIGFYNTSSSTLSTDANINNTIVGLTSTNKISQRSLDFLRSFDNWIRRNNYSGSKDVEKIYSRFGIKPEFYKANYCHLVNVSRTDVQVGDVTSLTDSVSPTETIGENRGAVLGAYAGKGIVNGDTGYNYRADDFGMLITLSWITLKPVYSNGWDRTVLKTSPLDFYNPEFDGLGGNPVSSGEVFVDRKNMNSVLSSEENIFGFNERYDEYKSGNLDQITGDFCVYEDMQSWHFDRTDLKALESDSALAAQSAAFNCIASTEGASIYNRIFNSEADEHSMSDHFYISASFGIDKYSNMRSLNEVPNLGEGNTIVPRNGNTLN